MEATTEEANSVQTKLCCTSEVCKSAPGCSTALLAKYSVDRWNYSWVVWKEHITLCVEKKRHSTPTSKPHPNCKVWGKGASWFGAALLPQALDSLLSLTEKWIPKFIKTFCTRMLDYLSAKWSSTEVGWCNRTMTQNTEVNQQQNSFNRRNTPSGVAQSESWPQPD